MQYSKICVKKTCPQLVDRFAHGDPAWRLLLLLGFASDLSYRPWGGGGESCQVHPRASGGPGALSLPHLWGPFSRCWYVSLGS